MGYSGRPDARWTEGWYALLEDEHEQVHFSEYSAVMQLLLNGYAELVTSGRPDQTIARAMMGATLNFYEMFGLSGELPHLLRSLADRIEHEASIN